ncbi:MAG: Clp protease N-terminal domain-containing protein [Vulcanimicrobiaceae bacterium]
MFSRFSAASRRVLRTAEQECRNHNHYYLGAEHLLEGLLQERDPAVLDALRASQIDIGEAHAEVRRSLGTGDERSWEGILVTPRLRKIVTLAEERAGDLLVEPLHLYEALRAEGGGLAADILRRAGRQPNAGGQP